MPPMEQFPFGTRSLELADRVLCENVQGQWQPGGCKLNPEQIQVPGGLFHGMPPVYQHVRVM